MPLTGADAPNDVESRFTGDPIAAISGQFPLRRPTAPTEPASGTRPWGLRDLAPATPSVSVPAASYDHQRQMSVLTDGSGRALVDLVMGPTAATTQSTDGEDPPSSEDWINDFAPDDPSCPF